MSTSPKYLTEDNLVQLKAKIPEFEVLPASEDPGEGSPLAENKILFIVED